MAEIALIVAEEYERRIKSISKKTHQGEVEAEQIEFPERLRQQLIDKVKAVGDGSSLLSLKIVSKALVPRTELGVAAFAGFFSA